MTMKVNHSSNWFTALDMQVVAGGSWRRVLQGYVQKAGTWQPFYTYVPYITTVTAVTPSSSTAVTYRYFAGPVTTSNQITITGAVTPASGTIPVGSAVELYNGATLVASTTTSSGGSYSFTLTSIISSTTVYTVKFVATGYYLTSSAMTVALTFHEGTATSAPTAPPTSQVTDTSMTLTGGTVVGDVGTTTCTGTVTLQRQTGPSTWATVATSTLDGSGGYSFTVTESLTPNTSYVYRVSYAGTALYDASVSDTFSVFFMRPTPGAFTATGGVMTTTAVSISWTASSDATSYDLYRDGAFFAGNITSPYTASGLDQDTSYLFYVVARNENTVDGVTLSTFLTANMGHVAVTEAGSITNAMFDAIETNSWRSSDGWGSLGTDMAQGYSSVGNGPYFGIARFDLTEIRNYIDTVAGRTGAWQHFTGSNIDVYTARQPGSGSAGAVAIGWYMSATNPGTGTPAVVLGPLTSSPSGLAQSTAGWMSLPDSTWATRLVAGLQQSIAMYFNGSTGYSQYNGGAGFKVRISGSWSYTVATAKASTWS
jgi:hypothetical protein